MGLELVENEELLGDASAAEKLLNEAILERRAAGAGKQPAPKASAVASDIIPDAEDVPAKLRGKSLAEVAQMYSKLESSYGRMANDLGVQRQMTDRLLNLNREADLAGKPRPKPVEVKSSDLLENPGEVIDRIVQERISAIQSENAQAMADKEAGLARDKFYNNHGSDYETVAADPEFNAWLSQSPYRLRAANAAYRGDWAAADELLTEFKARKTVTRTKEDDTQDNGVVAARKASLESGTSASDNASRKAGKVYRRADLMRLRATRPDLWEDDEFQGEILRAYAEGRVK